MSYKLSFGKHEGQTFEWIFFNNPGYAEYIYNNGIHRNEYCMDDEERRYFLNLYRQAWNLTGTCTQCNERPITRLGLSWQRNGNLGMVGFYCDECEYLGGSGTEYQAAAFFTEFHTIARSDQKRIIKEIKRLWIGRGNLTQAKMEEFFANDDNFSCVKPKATEKAAASMSAPSG